eukprot:TRINITY_DN51622_c0_g1_i1.p1 TRINITY_DN51622_c0_g1~~TRINITY_DN51622_c0_g1_i1.p1  ORF type:complete len:200 (-),score=45.96 TRINITY_DN51622_c0_g1_i1:30-629(-)
MMRTPTSSTLSSSSAASDVYKRQSQGAAPELCTQAAIEQHADSTQTAHEQPAGSTAHEQPAGSTAHEQRTSWKVGCEWAAGYSQEDATAFRVLFDRDLNSNSDSNSNLVAGSFVSHGSIHGRVVVCKVERTILEEEEGGAEIVERLVPFSKVELVDLCAWRRAAGSLFGCVSSRVFRENMRRAEMAGYLAENNRNQTFI